MLKFSEFDVCRNYVHKDKAKIIAYIEALYNKESALNNIQNLQDRKIAACQQVKLNPKDEYVISMMAMKEPVVNDLIFVYLSQFQNSNAFHQLCSDQQLFWSIQQVINKPMDTQDEDEVIEKYAKRAKLSETADEISKRINRLYSEIYSQEDSREKAVAHITQMLRPEERIRQRDEKNAA